MIRTRRLGIVLVAACLVLPAYAAKTPAPEVPADLAPRFREWLDQVQMLITEEERAYFLSLEEDFHRGAFIEAFWAARDTFDDTRFNEFQVHYEERMATARSNWGSVEDARAQTFVTQGEPFDRCWHPKKEVEVWIYDEAPEDAKIKSYDQLFPVLLFRPTWSDHYLRWLPIAAEAKPNESAATPMLFMPAQRPRLPDVPIIQWCGDSDVSVAMKRITARAYDWGTADPKTVYTIEIPEPSKEWVASFNSQTTILPEDAATFPARLAFEFPGHHQQRTVVQGVLEVDRAELAAFEGESGDGNPRHHQLLLLGEVVRGDELFERFRYRFEIPVRGGDDTPLALVFQRYWRPGPLRVLLKLEDLFGRRFAHLDQTLEVPDAADRAPAKLLATLRQDSQLYRALAEADAATARGERSLRLLAPPGVVVTGMERFQTVTVGDFDRVVFLLDEQPILAKKTPPYSVELDLGDVPSAHRLRVNGYGPGGEILATDEVLLNPGGQRFRVSLTEPQKGRKYRDSLRAAVQVAVPDGEELDRVELPFPSPTASPRTSPSTASLPTSATHFPDVHSGGCRSHSNSSSVLGSGPRVPTVALPSLRTRRARRISSCSGYRAAATTARRRARSPSRPAPPGAAGRPE